MYRLLGTDQGLDGVLGDRVYLASVVNLGMIWCFGFFFLELLDDFDEKSNNDDALASLGDADRNWAAIPTPVISLL